MKIGKPRSDRVVRVTAAQVDPVTGRYVRSKNITLRDCTPESVIARIKAMADDAEPVNQS